MINKSLRLAALPALCAMLLIGCNDDDSIDLGSIQQGQLDYPLAGIQYTTPTLSGVTTNNGTFEYRDGETVSFQLDELTLGETAAAEELTLADIVGAEHTYDEPLVKALRVAMEMDSDNNVYDGIDVADSSHLPPAGDLSTVNLDNYFNRVGSAKVYAYIDYLARAEQLGISAGNHHTLARTAAGRGFSMGESFGGVEFGEDPNKYCDLRLRLKLGRAYTDTIEPGKSLYTEGRDSLTPEENECYIEKFRNDGLLRAAYNPQPAWLNLDEDIVISSISTDQTDGAIVTDKGELYLFGPNNRGQLGLGHEDPVDDATLVTLPNNEKAVYATTASASTYVITEQGHIYASGDNGNLQQGQSADKDADRNTFGLVNLPTDEYFVHVATRDHHVYALTQQGDVYSWGNNNSGELGTGSKEDNHLPTEILSNKDIIAVEAGADFGLAVDATGQVYGWGDNGYGALTLGTPTTTGYVYKIEDIPEVLMPTPIAALSAEQLGDRIIRFYGGSRNAHALTVSGDVYSWGDQGGGYMGNGFELDSTINRDRFIFVEPQKVAALDDVNVVHFSSNTASHFALTEAGTVYAWGSTADGRLGVPMNHCEADNPEGSDSDVCYEPVEVSLTPQ